MALIAVAATSKRIYPDARDGEAFEKFLNQGFFSRINVEYRGKVYPMYHIFYKWFRCELIHEGKLPIDISFFPNDDKSHLEVRAGGAPEYLLKISQSWFYEILHLIKNAEINKDFFLPKLKKTSLKEGD